MKYTIHCTQWLQTTKFSGSFAEVVKEAERLSEFHGASMRVVDENGSDVGETYLPEPTYVFKVY
jgi:hypothetical protein